MAIRDVLRFATDESGEVQVEKASVLILATWMSAAGVVWGSVYVAFGESAASIVPYGYAALTLANVLVYRLLGRDRLFRVVQVLLSLLLPFLLQLALGGFTNSSAIILWSLVAPVAALVLIGERAAAGWFAAYVALIVIGGLLDHLVRRPSHLPSFIITAFFVMNVTAVSGLGFVLLRYFFRQKNTAVRAYIQQELAMRQSERLATLGKLSAGMAHELNNPAAAARRGAEQLGQAIAELQAVQRRLASADLSEACRDDLVLLDALIQERARTQRKLDPLTLSDLEDDIVGWMADRGVACSAESAATLAEMGCSPRELEDILGRYPAAAMADVVSWVGHTYTAHSLALQIGRGAAHISDIVNALKAYSYMDQAAAQVVDVTEGLENTLVMMRGRLRDGITVHREYAEDLPHVPAFGSELNQVWTHIIDNAVQAMDGQGEITMRTRAHDGWVEVEIEDNGPGIPETIQERIFDPFFTTKPPGSGTGLGLNVSHGIVVQKHGGRLAVYSKPGLTRFTVSLPASGAA